MRAFRMTDCASSLPGRSLAWQRPGGALPAPVPPRSPRRREGRGIAGPRRCQDSLPSVSNSVSMRHLEPPTYARVSMGVPSGALDR